LLERTTGWLCETQYELAANHLTIQVGESLNEGKKVLANIIPDNREKPVKVNQYCVSTWKPEVVNENILEGFRGAIVGYPTMQFSVQFNTEYSSNQNDSLISCDVIEKLEIILDDFGGIDKIGLLVVATLDVLFVVLLLVIDAIDIPPNNFVDVIV
jgi:hypothetical protein